MTLSIVDFLNARLAEDEAAARAVPNDGAPWHDQWVNDDGHALRTVNDHVLAYGHHGEPMKPGLLDHIARHDPARVLREVAVKRAIIELHVAHPDDPRTCGFCLLPTNGYDEHEVDWEAFPCRHLRNLATVYSDHPDYREEWRP